MNDIDKKKLEEDTASLKVQGEHHHHEDCDDDHCDCHDDPHHHHEDCDDDHCDCHDDPHHHHHEDCDDDRCDCHDDHHHHHHEDCDDDCCDCHDDPHHHHEDCDDDRCDCYDDHHHHHHHHDHGHSHGCGCGHCHHEEEGEELSVKALVIAGIFFVLGLLAQYLPLKNWLPVLGGPLFGNYASGITLQKVIYMVCYFIAYIIPGKSVLMGAVKIIVHHDFLDEEFLMSVASIGAIILGEYPEAAAIMLLYQIGEKFEDYAVEKSHNAIEEISKLRPDHAFVKNGDKAVEMEAEAVKVGSVIVVKPGDRIPIDGIVLSGESFLDTSALTGESVPRKVCAGDEVLSGAINKQGLLEIKTTKMAEDSALTRILELVEDATKNKTREEQFVTRFAKIYTPLVCGAALLIAILPSVITGFMSGSWTWSETWATWIERALMFLLVSCPCAIVISIPLSFSCGITSSAKRGILIKGSTYLEALSKTKTAVFDKTGTLTKGNFVVTDIHSMTADISKEQLLAIATHAELYSNHPISASLKTAHHDHCCENLKLDNLEEITGKGIKTKVNGKEVLAGNVKLMEQFNIQFEECKEHKSGTIIHVALDGKYLGHIVINDEIKPDSKAAVEGLKKAGVENIVMLTGDNPEPAQKVAEELGITRVYSQLLSGQKLEKVEELLCDLGEGKKKKGTLIFTGDGINDAPVLARADAGIAMGALGSDAAVEAADIIIMEDKPSKLVEGIKNARRTVRIVYENLIGSLGIKGAILILSALGITNIWVAVFGDVGVTILAVLNSLRLLKKKNN